MALVPARLDKFITADNNQLFVLYVAEINGARYFPINIGLFEAIALERKLEERTAIRPLTHDLALNIVSSLGGNLKEIHITALEKNTFYAELVIETDDGEIKVDSRPSDAMVLAATVNCELLVDESVFEQISK